MKIGFTEMSNKRHLQYTEKRFQNRSVFDGLNGQYRSVPFPFSTYYANNYTEVRETANGETGKR